MIHANNAAKLSLEQRWAYQGRARKRHFDFMAWCWQKQSSPFIEAKEVPFQRLICAEFDKAFDRYRKSLSTFLLIEVCFRQGKSDMGPRYLVPHFLGEFPDDETLITSHTDAKACEFSRFSRRIMKSPEYAALYPHVKLSGSRSGVEEWEISGHSGRAQYRGIGAGSAGMGGALVIIDDYFKNRAEAESPQLRDKVWEAFTDDIMTRRPDPAIIIIFVTPWHTDDLVGRLKERQKTAKDFPEFKELKFPAKSRTYPSGWLFPERFSPQWYTSQWATLSQYGRSGLMQCEPKPRTGAILTTEKIKIISRDELPKGLVFKRGYDLASSKPEERFATDPDYTAGIRMAVVWMPTEVDGLLMPKIYIDDLLHGRWEAPERKKKIVDTAMSDGAIEIGIEAFGAYKDAYVELRDTLRGIRQVKKMQLPGNKIAKAEAMAPAFEAGNVYLVKGKWNETLLGEVKDFPSGAHDDIIDAMGVTFQMHKRGPMIVTDSTLGKDKIEAAREKLRRSMTNAKRSHTHA